ncbi:MAG: DUF1552 domain-containing protein [Alphaproteobacteria bacterium]|nr:DUF1552 domain-containing protein [Alphaproteobacteria bacterium]
MSWSRRRFLRGAAGAAIALPVLPSLLPRGARAEGETGARLVVIYAPNGMHMPGWKPTTYGTGFALPTILQPFAGLRDRMTVLGGLDHTAAYDTAEGFHARSTASFLTGTRAVAATTALELRNGWSLDQRLAVERDGALPLSSLQMTPPTWMVPAAGEWPAVYHATISWRGNQPITGYATPLATWNRLTGGADAARLTAAVRGDRDARRRSVLDGALDDLATVRGRIGVEDAPVLDAYLSSVRAAEDRIVAGASAASCPSPDDLGSAFANYTDVADTFLEIARLALQCDLTRVVTYMFAAGGTGRTAVELGHVLDHHTLSHHGGSAAMQAQLQQLDVWEAQVVARFVQGLVDTPDGAGGTLLDDSVVLFGAGMSDGDSHSALDVPITLFGDAGGRLVSGTHLDVRGRKLADLHLTLLQALGVPATGHGDADGVLAALLA